MSLCKARLIELDLDFKRPESGGKNVPVQFNPESLKLTYANELAQPKGGSQAAGTAGRQFTGAGTTKLALQLWFDVGAQEAPADPAGSDGQGDPGETGRVDDVRRLTQHVLFFMTPRAYGDGPDRPMAPPGVRFEWGTFAFDGLVEAMEETIELFSPEGKPLRASINLTLTAQKILPRDASKDAPHLPPRRGHAPLSVARQGQSLQRMAAAAGRGDWQDIAAANGIEDPLRLAPGSVVNLHAGGAGRGGGLAPGGPGGPGALPPEPVGTLLQAAAGLAGERARGAALPPSLSLD